MPPAKQRDYTGSMFLLPKIGDAPATPRMILPSPPTTRSFCPQLQLFCFSGLTLQAEQPTMMAHCWGGDVRY